MDARSNIAYIVFMMDKNVPDLYIMKGIDSKDLEIYFPCFRVFSDLQTKIFFRPVLWCSETHVFD